MVAIYANNSVLFDSVPLVYRRLIDDITLCHLQNENLFTMQHDVKVFQSAVTKDALHQAESHNPDELLDDANSPPED